MNITLVKNGETKTYTQLFVSARYMRKALELRIEMDLNNLSLEDVDTVVNFVVDVFGKQFTSDDVYDGLSYDELINTVFEDVFMVVLQGQKQEPKTIEGGGKK
ncbi:MAG: hypothetical protein R3328_00030 [Planococcaceae bacterium]|nr:hypothetical protein [Planococcaceae bacterium]